MGRNPLGYKAQVLDIHYIKDEGDGYGGGYRIHIGKNNWGVVQWLEEKDIQPIRLTPEILEKNGWERLTTDENEGWGMEVLQYNEEQHLVYILNWRFDTWQPHLSIRSFTPEYGTFEMFDICFVHELQHALKLCGIDKEIIL